MLVSEPLQRLVQLLQDLKILGEVSVEPNQSVISIVGTEMQTDSHIQGRVFEALNKSRVKIHMVSLSNALINLSFVVDDAACDTSVRLLHHEFFNS